MRARALRSVVVMVVLVTLAAACAADDAAAPGTDASPSPPASTVATTVAGTPAPPTEAVTLPVTEPVTQPPVTAAPTTTVPAGPPTLPPAGATRVLVLNAGFKDGGAGATADGLRAIGYQVLTPQNALEERKESAVYFREGWELAAREVAERSGIRQELVAPLPGNPITDPQPSGFEVAVLLGRDRR